MARRDIIVIGGSMGASGVLRGFLPHLPADFPASVLIVVHIAAGASPLLAERLGKGCAMPVSVAIDGQPVEPGHIYVAPAGQHMLLFPGVIRLGRGPRENMSRPAIDPLFRSAALAYGGRVIGLILTGYLNDGASGLFEVKRRGGLALVQQPLEAEAMQMPQAAVETVAVDRIVRTADIAAALGEAVRQEAPGPPLPPSAELELEVNIALGRRLGSEELGRIAEPSTLTCPHCQGVLSEIQHPGPLRYRCQTGHAFTAESVMEGQQESVGEAMMIALRVMEERITLVARMGREARHAGRDAAAELYESRAEEYEGYAGTLRQATMRSLEPLSVAAS
jgi:two-component system chemotaxis response regulator CheB